MTRDQLNHLCLHRDAAHAEWEADPDNEEKRVRYFTLFDEVEQRAELLRLQNSGCVQSPNTLEDKT